MKLLRPKFERIEIDDIYRGVSDSVLTKDISLSGKTYEYVKTFSIEGTRYFIEFVHSADQPNNELSIHFGLVGTYGNPVTNAGLEVFGKIVDEMATAYEEILQQEPIDRILLTASLDGYSKDDIERVKEIIAEDPSKINGLEIKDDEYRIFSIKFENSTASIKTKGKLGVTFTDTIPVTLSMMDDIKHIAKIDISEYGPDMLNYIKGAVTENKKQTQRLKLYQFYLHK
jgi:hypothetical protein